MSTKKDIQMTRRHMKRCSTSLIIKEKQSKTTMRHHLTPIRIAIIKKSTNKNAGEGVEKRHHLLHCWWEYKLVQPPWETVWRFLRKLKIDPAIPLLGIGIYPDKTVTGERYTHLCVHRSPVHTSQNMLTT